MNFQRMIKIEKPDYYLDLAFGNASKKADLLKGKKSGSTREGKAKTIELERISTVDTILTSQFERILQDFPSFDQLPEFYKELMKATFDVALMKKSLGGINYVKNKIKEFHGLYRVKIKKCMDMRKIFEYRTSFYGRASSLVKQIKKELAYLDECRKLMKRFPDVKEMHTICIGGFPNVGKTTLLAKLTGSKPEISAYAFTTKDLNIGYITQGHKKIQLIDTPGTLNRLDKMNNIERQAYLAMQYCANSIIYVFDLTETYPVEDQVKLYKKIKKMQKPLMVYFSKSDLIDGKVIKEFKEKNNIDGFSDAEKIKEETIAKATNI